MRMPLLWIRSSPALYAAPIGVGLVLYIIGNDIGLQPRSWSEVVNLPQMYQFYTAGVASIAAAWDVGRLRRGSIEVLLPVRGRWNIIGLGVLPAVLLGLLLHAVFWGTMAARIHDVTGGLPWASVLVILLNLAAWVSAGAAIGWIAPPIIAAPSVAAIAFTAMAYSAAVEDPKWRNISGDALSRCCEVDEVLRPEVWWATVLPVAGLATASLIVLAGRPTLLRGLLAALVAVGAVGFALPYGETIGWEATRPRDHAGLQCETSQGREVCLWPEYEPMRADLTSHIAAVASAFEEFGVEVPATIIQDGHDETGQWRFVAGPDFDDYEMHRSIAFGLLADNYDSCQFEVVTEYGPLLSDEVPLVMGDWLEHAVLDGADAAGYTNGTAFGDFLRRLYAADPHVQGAWFNQLNTALRDCNASSIPLAFNEAAEAASK